MRWVGVDLSGGSFHAAYSDGTEVPEREFKAVRTCGCRVGAALPAEGLFTERIDLPPAARKNPAKYVPGLLDVRLPVPVEDCLVVSTPPAGSMAMAFAVRREEYARFIDAFRDAAGCRPERAVPAPLALWGRVCRDFQKSGRKAAGLVLHLHAGSESWTLLAGVPGASGREPSIPQVATVPAGDIPSVLRDFKILQTRAGASATALSLSGASADESLARELGGVAEGARVTIVDSPALYLAAALAADGEMARDATEGSFAYGDQEHPALSNRRFHRNVALLLLPLAASAAFFAVALFCKVAAASKLRDFNAAVGVVAKALAGRTLPYSGAAAIRAAQNEFGERVSPAVEGFANPGPVAALKDVFSFAATRDAKIAAFSCEENELSVTGRVEDEGDVAVLVSTLESAGFAVAVKPAPDCPGGFSLVLSNAGGEP